jgi:hypothetical protein
VHLPASQFEREAHERNGEMKDLFAMIMSDPVLRTQFIEWAQRQTKAAEEDKLVRDLGYVPN